MIGIKRGDIYYADLSPVVGSEQGGVRPVLIIQNDMGNKHSPTVIAAAITSRMGKTKLPTHIELYAQRAGLARDSVVLLEQLRTLDKRRLKEKMGHLDEGTMGEIDTAIAVSLGLLPHGAKPFSHTVTPSFAPPAAVAGVDGAAIGQAGTAPLSPIGTTGSAGAVQASQVSVTGRGRADGNFEGGGEASV
ncbi:MAG: type II toxin-antitoxin system PemK/MazF family toxin [Ruminococcaceae bacterium]|nr:type II toxin-antitoxin system PemK/MazF family toxin [Oscillospiraceae bacterium]